MKTNFIQITKKAFLVAALAVIASLNVKALVVQQYDLTKISQYILVENFETATVPSSYNSNQSSFVGLTNWSYQIVSGNPTLSFIPLPVNPFQLRPENAVTFSAKSGIGNDKLIKTVDLSLYNTDYQDVVLNYNMNTNEAIDGTNDYISIKVSEIANPIKIKTFGLSGNDYVNISEQMRALGIPLTANTQIIFNHLSTDVNDFRTFSLISLTLVDNYTLTTQQISANLILPITKPYGFANDIISVSLTNNQNIAVTGVNVTVKIISPSNTVIFTDTKPYPGVLNPSSSTIMTNFGVVNTKNAGKYTYEITIGNATITNVKKIGFFNIQEIPYKMGFTENFAITPSAYWYYENNTSYGTFINKPSNKLINSVAVTNSGATASVVSPKVQTEGSNPFLKYSVFLETSATSGGPFSNTITANDVFTVELFSDEGATTIHTISPAEINGAGLKQFRKSIPVAFQNKPINIRFKAQPNASSTNFLRFALDSVSLINGYNLYMDTIKLSSPKCGIGSTNDDITLRVVNNGSINMAVIPVEVQVRNLVTKALMIPTIQYTYPGVINSGSSATFTIPQKINTLASGTYEIFAFTNATDSAENDNGKYYYKTVGSGLLSSPYFEPNNSPNTNWVIGGSPTTAGITYSGGELSFLLDGNQVKTVTSQSFQIKDKDSLFIPYRVVANYGSGVVNQLSANDVIKFQISNDCETTWTTLSTVNSTTYGISANGYIYKQDLSAYKDQKISIRISNERNVATGGSYTVYYNYFKVQSTGDIDFGLTNLITSDYLCQSLNENVKVVVQNYGSRALSTIPIKLTITDPYGATSVKNYNIATTPTIAYNASTTLTLDGINIIHEGKYSFTAETTVPFDNLTTNNQTSSYDKSYPTSIDVPVRVATSTITWIQSSFTMGAVNCTSTNVAYIPSTATSLDTTAYVITDRYEKIKKTDYLYFDYSINNNDASNNLNAEDVVKIEYTDDCTRNFKLLGVVDNSAGKTNVFARQYFPLDKLAGKPVMFRIHLVKKGIAGGTTWFNFTYKNFGISEIKDIEVTELTHSNKKCGSIDDYIKVEFRNNGIATATNIPIHVVMRTDNYDVKDTLFIISSLAAGQRDTVRLKHLNTTYVGDYSFYATAQNAGDINAANDTKTDFTPIFDATDINSYKNQFLPIANWNSNNIVTSNLISVYTNSLNEATSTLTFIESPQLKNITSNSVLSFRYYAKSTEIGLAGVNYRLGLGDEVKVKVLTDCGASETVLTSFVASNTITVAGRWITANFPIGQFADKNIRIRFDMSKIQVPDNSSNSYQFYLDSLMINSGIDARITNIISSTSSCSSASESVVVRIRNNYVKDITGASVTLTITSLRGTSIQTLSQTKSIAAFTNDSVTFNYNSIGVVGKNKFFATINIPSDFNSINDTLTTFRSNIDTVFTAPYIKEIPIVLTNDWKTLNGSWSITPERNLIAYVDPTPSNYVATLLSPRLKPVSGISRLEFDYRITSYTAAGNVYDNNLDRGDSIIIYALTDCQSIVKRIAVIDSINHVNSTEMRSFGIDVKEFEGKEVYFKAVIKCTKLYNDRRANYNVEFNNFELTNGIDVGVTKIIRKSQVEKCGYNSEPVWVDVKNFGTLTQTKIPIKLEVYDAIDTVITTEFIGVLQANQTTRVFVGNVNTSKAGTYEFHALTTLVADTMNKSELNNHKDDVLVVHSIIPTPYASTPTIQYLETFSNPVNNWITKKMSQKDSTFMYSNGLLSGDTAILISPKLGAIKKNQYLTFNFKAVTYYGSPMTGIIKNNGYRMGGEDSLYVQVTTDCGRTYKTIYVVDSAKYNPASSTVDMNFYKTLSDYEGQTVSFRFLGTHSKGRKVGTTVFMYTLDNIGVSTIDYGVTSVSMPYHDNNCGTVGDTIKAIIQNFSYISIDTIPVSVEFTGNKAIDRIFKKNVAANIPYGASKTIVMGVVNTFQQPGTYKLDAYTNFAWDSDKSNDTTGNEYIVNKVEPITYFEEYNSSYMLSKGTTDVTTINKRIGVVSKNDFVAFGYYVKAYDKYVSTPILGNYLRNDDKLELWISDDCGGEYKKAFVIDTFNHHGNNKSTYASFSLNAYEGKTVSFQFKFVKGNVGITELFFNNLYVGKGIDATVSIDTTNNRTCGLANEYVSMYIHNKGYQNLTNVIYSVEMKSSTGTLVAKNSGVYTGIIPPADSVLVSVGKFNPSTASSYTLVAKVSITNENDATNNEASLTNVYAFPMRTISYIEDFESTNASNTIISNMPTDWTQTTTSASNTFKAIPVSGTYTVIGTSPLKNKEVITLTTPKVGTVNGGTMLDFNYLIETYDLNNTLGLGESATLMGNYLRNGDIIDVSVSTNCGTNYTSIFKLDGSMANDTSKAYHKTTVSLAQFAGSQILVKFTLTKGEIGMFSLKLDSFAITNPDAGITDVQGINGEYSQSRLATCSERSDTIFVEITNYGKRPISNVPVTLNVFDGTKTVTFNKVYTQTIPAGYEEEEESNVAEPETTTFKKASRLSTMRLLPDYTVKMFMGVINTTSEGYNELEAYTTVVGDNDKTNDRTGFIISNRPKHVPYSAYTENSNNSQLTEWNNDWSFEYNANYFKFNEFNATAIGVMGISKNQKGEVYSPKVSKVTTISYLEFNYKLFNELFLEEDDLTIERLSNFEESIFVEISSDCGLTYNREFAYKTAFNDTSFIGKVYIDLGKYAGKEILTRFVFSKGSSNGEMTGLVWNVKYNNKVIKRPKTPEAIDTLFCNFEKSTFTTLPIASSGNTVKYNWKIEPKEAGKIIDHDDKVVAVWNQKYFGKATVSVQGVLYSYANSTVTPPVTPKYLGSSSLTKSSIKNGYDSTLFQFIDVDGFLTTAWSNPYSFVLDACLDKKTDINSSSLADVKVYPTPTEGILNIEIPNLSGIATLKVVNTQGTTVSKLTQESAKQTFNLSSLPKGIYFIEINANDAQERRKIIVQ